MIGPYEPGICPTSEFGVYQGDAWELAALLPDQSIDCIWTDPEYNRAEDYMRLAKLARRVLKPTGHLLSFYGIAYTEQTYRALREGGLPVKWQLIVWQPGQTGRVHPKIFIAHYNAVWCPRSELAHPFKATTDTKTSYNGQMQRRGSMSWSWRKNPNPIMEWLPSFCPVDGVVLDIFSGFCSIPEAAIRCGRKYIAFEQDRDKVDWSRDYLANNVQPALIAPDGEDYQTMSLLGALSAEEGEVDGSEAEEPDGLT